MWRGARNVLGRDLGGGFTGKCKWKINQIAPVRTLHVVVCKLLKT